MAAGPIIVVLAGLALIGKVGPCIDFTGEHVVRTSKGLGLPIPLAALCPGAASLFLWFYCGYLVALAGMLTLLFGRMRLLFLVPLALAASGIAAGVPFVLSADPYAYALYAIEAFVLHVSPYAPHHLTAPNATLKSLITLFPTERAGERIANYGPVFIGAYGALLAPFAAVSLKAMIIAERIIGATLLLVLALLLSLVQTSARARRLVFTAVALNPLLIFESVSFAHGDITMMTLLAGAYAAYVRNRIALAAILCVLAAETRAVAAVALVVLLIDLSAKRGIQDCVRPAAFAAGTFVLTAAASVRFFGTFTLGNGPTLAPGAPVVLLFESFGLKSFPIGVALQAAIGVFAIYFALRSRAFRFVPAAALAALPVVRAWYLQWLVPVAALSDDRALQGATLAAVILAPLAELPELLARGGLPTWFDVVSIQWLVPIGAYIFIRNWSLIRYAEDTNS